MGQICSYVLNLPLYFSLSVLLLSLRSSSNPTGGGGKRSGLSFLGLCTDSAASIAEGNEGEDGNDESSCPTPVSHRTPQSVNSNSTKSDYYMGSSDVSSK
jgi:hypothetical protein